MPGSGPWPTAAVLLEAAGQPEAARRDDNDGRLVGRAPPTRGHAATADVPATGTPPARDTCMIRMIRETWRRQGPTFADIEATGRWLAERPDCTGRVGVIGFCLGGGFALLLAAEHRFDAASVNYGPVSKKAYSDGGPRRRVPGRRQLRRQGSRQSRRR